MKTALVTGGTHGIGQEIVNDLIFNGYKVDLCARGKYTSNRNFIQCDLTIKKDIDKLLQGVPEVDILICNSGGGGRWGDDDWINTGNNVWQEVYDKNVGYMINLINHYLPKMIAKKWGRIIAISSIVGKESANEARPWFQSVKSAQISMIKAYSRNKNYVRNGITFNTISPGAIYIPDTGWDKMKIESPDKYNEFIESLPMGKIGNAYDISNVVNFLCKDESSFINGSNIVVDGGQSFSF